MAWKTTVAVLLCAAGASAQQFELGGTIGYGFYRNGQVFSPAGTIQAGVRDRFAAGFVFGEDLYEHVSGEVRYLYQDGDPFLEGRGVRSDIQGRSHAFHYDLLFHTSRRAARLRPFFAIGAGAKGYIIAGPAPSQQPLANTATLETRDEWKFLVTVGVGVKYALRRDMILRLEVKDYLTPFPKRQIAPVGGASARGIFQQITPQLGLSYRF
jgi:opacity protein-like surface antigen